MIRKPSNLKSACLKISKCTLVTRINYSISYNFEKIMTTTSFDTEFELLIFSFQK